MFPRPVAAAPEPVEAERGADHDRARGRSRIPAPGGRARGAVHRDVGRAPGHHQRVRAKWRDRVPPGGVARSRRAGRSRTARTSSWSRASSSSPSCETPTAAAIDIQLTVVESFFQAGDRALLHMSVPTSSSARGERETPRAPVSEVAEAQIQYSAVLPEKSRMEVRVADVSLARDRASHRQGCRRRRHDAGRRDRARPKHDHGSAGRPYRPAAFGRYRMGCEITRIGAADRAFLGDLAASVRSGSPDQRRPETIEVLSQSRAEQAPLKERLRPAD